MSQADLGDGMKFFLSLLKIISQRGRNSAIHNEYEFITQAKKQKYS